MAIRTITAANLVYMLSIPGIVSAPTRIFAFAVDDAFSQGEVDHTELQLGVDAVVAGGWIPALIPQKLMFLASSPSIDIFENWARVNATTQNAIIAQGTVNIPAVQKTYNMVNGYLKGYQPMPDAKKVLGPRAFTITWSDIQPSLTN